MDLVRRVARACFRTARTSPTPAATAWCACRRCAQRAALFFFLFPCWKHAWLQKKKSASDVLIPPLPRACMFMFIYLYTHTHTHTHTHIYMYKSTHLSRRARHGWRTSSPFRPQQVRTGRAGVMTPAHRFGACSVARARCRCRRPRRGRMSPCGERRARHRPRGGGVAKARYPLGLCA